MKLFFAGSFNPFTVGHADIVNRALDLGAEVVIAVGYNIAKADLEQIDSRVDDIAHVYAREPRVTVTSYSGLTVDAAQDWDCSGLLRGVRSVADFEYERNMADVNRQISGIDTLLLMADPRYAAISSSMVRELQHYGHDISQYLPS